MRDAQTKRRSLGSREWWEGARYQRTQKSLLQIIVFPEAPPEQENAAVRPSPCDKNGRILVAVGIGEDVFIDEVRFGVDWDSRHERHVSENHPAFRIDQRDEIQAADIPRQTQLQRLAQVGLAPVDALAASSTRIAPTCCMSALETWK